MFSRIRIALKTKSSSEIQKVKNIEDAIFQEIKMKTDTKHFENLLADHKTDNFEYVEPFRTYKQCHIN